MRSELLWYVVLAGIVSYRIEKSASCGPVLVAVMTYSRTSPGITFPPFKSVTVLIRLPLKSCAKSARSTRPAERPPAGVVASATRAARAGAPTNPVAG
jgi:hypothetical protein